MSENVTSSTKQVLLINDLPGYGKVALAAMVPILSHMGYYTYQLPTAIVSNTLDYGKFRIEDMTSFMKDTMKVWDELGFSMDCICTGFVLSEAQVDLIREYIDSRKEPKPLVIVDPIMADGGKLYNGIGEDRIVAMRKLVACSDVMVPNITEASLLTNIRPGMEEGTEEEIRELVDGLRAMSGKSVVITSAMDRETGEHFVCGYDCNSEEDDGYFRIPYNYIPIRIAGSGDIFSALMTGHLLNGLSLKESVGKAVATLSKLIQMNEKRTGEYKGISIEQYWDALN